MYLKRVGVCLALTLGIVLGSGVKGYCESEIVKKFTEAMDNKDLIKANAIIEENKAKVPAEVKALLDEALSPQTSKEDRNAKIYLAEVMARSYKDATGDVEPLKDVKKKDFETRLSAPVKSTAKDGVHTVEFPKASAEAKNIFKPDNIVIKKGETVKWVNNDEIGHVFASMPLIGNGGIFSPRIEPGNSWTYKFDKPGEYYYICFIHHGMVGKITVEE